MDMGIYRESKQLMWCKFWPPLWALRTLGAAFV
jgi:hypothetical protein